MIGIATVTAGFNLSVSQKTEFNLLMEPVALRLLGEPAQKNGKEWRYGSRGSLAIDTEKGTWFDHESNEGGGVLALLKRSGHEPPAAWLQREGLLNGGSAQFRSSIVETYNYRDESGALLFQVVRFEPKDFRQRRPDGQGGWDWKLGDTRRVPYRLPELVKAVAAGQTIYIPEGEKDVESLRVIGFAATTNPGGVKKWRDAYSEFLRRADVVVLPDNHLEGREHAEQVVASLRGIARRVRVLDIGKIWPECPPKGDISDWLATGGSAEQLKQIMDSLPEVAASAKDEQHGDHGQTIVRLATLPTLAYQQQRKTAAKELGIKVDALDKLVRGAKAQAEEAQSALPHWNVEPWAVEVSGVKLLDDIERVFRKYIVLPEGAGVALALWTLHAWTMDAGDISPFLVLVSPTKRCGKTNALIILYYLTPRSELASNISASALFRYVEEVRPTLLIDEADSFLKDNEEMRGILDSGHTKTAAHVIRNVEVNGDHKPRRFSTWAPKSIATIRALADTLEDRAIVVQLQRKPKTACVVRLRKRDNEEFAMLRRQAARWAGDNFSRLTDPEPDIPEALNDRAADNWRPLLAIADLAGNGWPGRARDAACVLSGEGHDATSMNVELLADIRLAFGEADIIRSADLVTKLTADPERPWAEWRHGKPLTQKQLAGLLRPFGIVSEEVHPVGQSHGKGYKRVRFEDLWEAYVPGQNSAPGQFQPSEARNRASADLMGTSCDFRSAREASPRGSKNANLSHGHAGLRACADRKPESGGACQFDQEIIPSAPIPSAANTDPQVGPASAGEDRTCAQCRGPVDGKERQVAVEGSTVWLHPECQSFYLPNYPALPDSLNRNLRNGAAGHVRRTGSIVQGDFQ